MKNCKIIFNNNYFFLCFFRFTNRTKKFNIIEKNLPFDNGAHQKHLSFSEYRIVHLMSLKKVNVSKMVPWLLTVIVLLELKIITIIFELIKKSNT